MSRCPMTLVTLIALAVWLSSAEESHAQSFGVGGTASQAPSSGSASAPGFSLSTRFQSNFGQFTGGSQSAGQTTAGANAGTTGFGQGQSTAGRNTSALGALGAFGGLGALGGSFGNRSMFGGNNQQGTNNSNKTIRTRLRLGFTSPRLNSAAVSQSATKIVNRVLTRSNESASPITVKIQNRTAVLVGIVESDHARDLAERLVLLEPGIEAVQNELTVGPGAPALETSPKPSRAGQRP